MKATVEHEGKTVTFDIPAEVLEKLIAQKPRTGYERTPNRCYFTSYKTGDISYERDDETCLDEAYYNAANYCTDERLARDNARADTLMRRLRRCAAEHGGIPSQADWLNPRVKKWCVTHDYESGVYASDWFDTRIAGAVYFSSKEACEATIDEFRDELTWYFAQYDPQLREA